MNRRTTTTRLAATFAAVALPLGLAACGGGAESSSSEGAGSSESSASSAMSEDGAARASAPFGDGCAAVPEDGKGSFDGMAKDPVATAAGNNPALSTLVGAITEAELAQTLDSADGITVFAARAAPTRRGSRTSQETSPPRGWCPARTARWSSRAMSPRRMGSG